VLARGVALELLIRPRWSRALDTRRWPIAWNLLVFDSSGALAQSDWRPARARRLRRLARRIR
jgi:hypothetical protein